jgi:hypothetical protein
MPLPVPQLDTRTFDDLVREARERIPRFTPEWTNLNDSDPGMTLVKLQAWLTETVLYELNRLPQSAYVKFLNLLHVEPYPAQAAKAELQFRLAKLNKTSDPLTVPIPAAARVDVDDPDLATPVTFETDRALVAINAGIGAVVAPRAGAHPIELVTTWDDGAAATTFLHAFAPFGAEPSATTPLLIGLVLRPVLDAKLATGDYSQDVLPAIELDIAFEMAGVGDSDAKGGTIVGPLSRKCLRADATQSAAGVRWQIFSGSAAPADAGFPAGGKVGDWTDLSVRGDDTAGLSRSGHIRLQLSEHANRFSPEALPQRFYEKLGLLKPPTTLDELKALLTSGATDMVERLTEDDWKAMAVPEAHLNALVNDCTEDAQVATELNTLTKAEAALVKPAALSPERWNEIEPRIAILPTARFKGVARQLYWLRATWLSAGAGTGQISAIRLNIVPATAASTRLAERLGTSDARPTTTYALSKLPVLMVPDADDPTKYVPDLDLTVEEAGATTTWTRVDDFYAQPADATVYTLDPVTGTIGFAPRGRVPVGGATITAARYRTGGGAIGNVGAGRITKIKGAIRHVESVTNPRAASGGEDAEPFDETLARAPHELRTRDRAVTAEDFAYLAAHVDGVAVQRAYALANRKPDPAQVGRYLEQPGAVTVVVLPISTDPRPQPSDAQMRLICNDLDARRLISTELYLTGPRYVTVASLAATVTIAPSADLGTVGSAASAALLAFLHPLKGGGDGAGWPFGAPIDFADLYDTLLALPDVRRVTGLAVAMDAADPDTDPTGDVIGIPDGALVWLRPEVIKLNVVYDNR